MEPHKSQKVQISGSIYLMGMVETLAHLCSLEKTGKYKTILSILFL